MPVDLDKIRALLASVVGFTEGPWTPYKWSLGSAELVASKIAQVARNSGGSDLHAAIKQIGDAEWIYPAFTGNGPTSGPNAALIAAAPDLHRDLTEAVGEIERLRAHRRKLEAILTMFGYRRAVEEIEAEIWRPKDGLAAGEVDDG